MAKHGRATRVPGYDTQVHIVRGGDKKSGSPGLAQQADDALLEHDDPMEFSGGKNWIESHTPGMIKEANRQQSAGLASGMGGDFGAKVGMASAGRNSGPKAASGYGPRNTGEKG